MRTAILVGLLAGIGLGLFYAWIIDPVEFTTADPSSVEARYPDVWIISVAEAYQASGDWPRAEMRLNALRDPNLAQTVSALFDRVGAEGPNPAARALARLADRLGARSAGMIVYLTTPVVTSTPTAPPVAPTRTPTRAEPSPTPTDSFPTLTPTATPPPEFVVVGRQSECLTDPPQIRVTVQALDRSGLPGVDVWITWDGGADRFVTGLKPEFGSGFGDFDMQPNVSYRVGAGAQSALALVNNLRAGPCNTPAGAPGRLTWNIVLRSLASDT